MRTVSISQLREAIADELDDQDRPPDDWIDGEPSGDDSWMDELFSEEAGR